MKIMNKNIKKYFCLPIFFLTSCGGGGGGSGSDSQQNTAPDLVGLIDYAIDENTSEVAIIQATDAEGDAISYSISGVDSPLLSINPSSGLLAFQSPPDYENPQDNNQDNIYSISVSASDGKLSTSLGIIISVNDVDEISEGYNMLLIGHSFFKPYADRIGILAKDAGYNNHEDTVVFSGGVSGTPIAFWNSTGEKNRLIKETLDRSDIDIFGMAAGLPPENPVDGFRDWIAYALQNNPNITIFLSTPQPDFPNDWQQKAQDAGYTTMQEAYAQFHNQEIHKTLIDELRAEFPRTIIFCIPTGESSIKLREMYDDNSLLDDILFIGPFENSLFTDEKGHQGKIITSTGTLMWLNGIYKVHLRTNDFDTGFNTDLHTIAEDIMNSHDAVYNH